MKLYIGNKNYSSWSMRPWVLMRHFDVPFDEVMLRFDGFDADSKFKQALRKISPAGRVPVLVDGDLVVWDTLAIVEYLAERHADVPLWPREQRARARARTLCAEMHAGFAALRSHCPQNIEASLPDVGAKVLAEQAAVRADLARLDAMWCEALAAGGGPFLFGDFTIADAFYAPVVGRLRTYALPVSPAATAYLERVWASRGVAAWVREALAEHDFRDFEEPYRRAPSPAAPSAAGVNNA
jgi:glutathione S-transferase